MEKITFLRTIVHLIRCVVDFGYLSKEQIGRLVQPLLNIFEVFTDEGKSPTHWMSRLVRDCLSET